MASFNTHLPKDNKMFLDLVTRYMNIFEGCKYSYFLHSTCIFDTEPNGKTKQKGFRFSHSEGNYKGPRTLELPGLPIDGNDFVDHLFYSPGSMGPNILGKYIVRPPMTSDFRCKWGALDVDVYNDKKKYDEENKRIIKQIFDEKLLRIPVFSKSKGLHLFLFVDDYVPVLLMRRGLEFFRDKLKLSPKTELFPKQTKQEFELNYPTLAKVGNGIQIPYGGCFYSNEHAVKHYLKTQEPGNMWAKVPDPGELKEGWHKQNEEMIINENMETATLDKFIETVEASKLTKKFFDDIPLDLPERVVKETPLFSDSDAKPLSDLENILNNIRNKVEHEKGGAFDNWIVEYVATAIGKHNQSDDEILEPCLSVWEFADTDTDTKGNESYQGAEKKDYFKTKIDNCRKKFDKKDPGPAKKQFMESTFYLMDQEKYTDFRTGRIYGERAIETKFHKIFGGGITAPTYFKKHQTDRNIVESAKYKPGKWSPTEPVFTDSDELQYYNKYKPGPLKPRNVLTFGELDRFFTILNFMVPVEEYREWVLDWLAGIVQHPGHKWRWVLFFYSKGKQVGKGSLFRVMEMILGEENTMETKVALMLDKGSMYTERQLVLIDECKSKGDWRERKHLANDLKMIITGKKVSARRMRVDYQQVENNANFKIFSNDKKAISLEDDEKRYLVLFHESPRLDQHIYDDFHDWLEGPDKSLKNGKDGGAELIYDFLQRRQIKLPLNGVAPETIFQKEMEQSTTEPITEQLREWMSEENGPFSLRCGDIRGTTEVREYINKNCQGAVVKLASDPKQLKQSLLNIGAVFLGQVRHKFRDEKPMLCIVRNHKEYEGITNTVICNEHWKPLMIEKQSETVQNIVNENNAEQVRKNSSDPIVAERFEKQMGFKS